MSDFANNLEVRVAISGVSMPNTMVDYSTDNSLNSAAGTGDPFSTPTGSGSSASTSTPDLSSMSAPDAQALASSMLGSLPDLSSAWAGVAGG